jgi:hypothetical protein
MTVIIHHMSSFIAFLFTVETSFLWWIVNVSQHAAISLVQPLYCSQVNPGPYSNVPHKPSFTVLHLRSSGTPHLFSLKVPQVIFFVKSLKSSREEKKLSMYNFWPHPSSFLVRPVTVAWVAIKCYATHFLSFPKETVMSRVTSWVTRFVSFNVTMPVLIGNVLCEYHPSLKQHNHFINCQIFWRAEKFWKCPV